MTPKAWFASELQRYERDVQRACSYPRQRYVDTAKALGLLVAGVLGIGALAVFWNDLDALGRIIPRWVWLLAALAWVFPIVRAYTRGVDDRFKRLEDRGYRQR